MSVVLWFFYYTMISKRINRTCGPRNSKKYVIIIAIFCPTSGLHLNMYGSRFPFFLFLFRHQTLNFSIIYCILFRILYFLILLWSILFLLTSFSSLFHHFLNCTIWIILSYSFLWSVELKFGDESDIILSAS